MASTTPRKRKTAPSASDTEWLAKRKAWTSGNGPRAVEASGIVKAAKPFAAAFRSEGKRNFQEAAVAAYSPKRLTRDTKQLAATASPAQCSHDVPPPPAIAQRGRLPLANEAVHRRSAGESSDLITPVVDGDTQNSTADRPFRPSNCASATLSSAEAAAAALVQSAAAAARRRCRAHGETERAGSEVKRACPTHTEASFSTEALTRPTLAAAEAAVGPDVKSPEESVLRFGDKIELRLEAMRRESTSRTLGTEAQPPWAYVEGGAKDDRATDGGRGGDRCATAMCLHGVTLVALLGSCIAIAYYFMTASCL